MSKEQPSKKLRLEYQTGGLVSDRNDDEEMWGEDFCVDDQELDKIESQAFSQVLQFSTLIKIFAI